MSLSICLKSSVVVSLFFLACCHARFLSCWHQRNDEFLPAMMLPSYEEDDSSRAMESIVQVFSVSDTDSYLFDNLVRSIVDPVSWIFYQLEAAQEWNRFVVYSLLSSTDSSLVVSVSDQGGADVDLLSTVAMGRFYAAMQDLETYKKAADAANVQGTRADALDQLDKGSAEDLLELDSAVQDAFLEQSREEDNVSKYVVVYGGYYDDEGDEKDVDHTYEDIYNFDKTMHSFYDEATYYDSYGYEDLYSFDTYEEPIIYDLTVNDWSVDEESQEPVDELLGGHMKHLHPLMEFWSLLSDPDNVENRFADAEVSGSMTMDNPTYIDLDWHLIHNDGEPNWNLLMFLALSFGCISTLTAFFVSLMQLRQVLRRSQSQFITSETVSPLLSAPVKCLTLDTQKGQQVEVAREYIPPQQV